MTSKHFFNTNKTGLFIRLLFLLLSLAATVKLCFFSLGIDEEYAVTMAYRIAAGDRMFLTMWEPHQTSGFVSALFIKIFLTLTGGTDYLVLYLRIAGVCIQALISLFLYTTLKKYTTEGLSFAIALFFYNTLPKWIPSPEFSNMLIWFSVLAFLCFLRYYANPLSPFSRLWLIGAGAGLSGLVLSYPSCLLAVWVFFLGMYLTKKEGFLKDMAVTAGTCLLLGLGYIGYFLGHMSIEEFLYGLSQMMTDGTHAASAAERLLVYGKEFLSLLPYLGVCLLPGMLAALIFKGCRTLQSFLRLTLAASLIQQVFIWLSEDSRYLQQPLIYFYILYFSGIMLSLKKGFLRRSPGLSPLFFVGSLWGGAVWLCALAITNTTISVTGSYLMPGLISGLIFLCEEKQAKEALPVRKALSAIALLFLLTATLFAKGYLVCANAGAKDTIAYVKQKALSGPAKGIYMRYMEGYQYNLFAGLMEKYNLKGAPVLYAGQNQIYYLLGDMTIGTPSTISTPTFDERLFDYWERNPGHRPLYIICDDANYLEEIKQLLSLEKPLLEENGFLIFETKWSEADIGK